MGADNFVVIAKGATAQEAFSAAVTEAQYDYGHAGYTGTIAEKDSFVTFDVPALREMEVSEIEDWAEARNCPDRYEASTPNGRISQAVDDKWGPAGHVDLGDGRHLFFGWASS